MLIIVPGQAPDANNSPQSRFIAMSVMFHELASRVQNFWPLWTLGYLGYRIGDRLYSYGLYRDRKAHV